MSETSEKRTLVPHFLIIGVIIVIILAIVFWPSEEEILDMEEHGPGPDEEK